MKSKKTKLVTLASVVVKVVKHNRPLARALVKARAELGKKKTYKKPH